MGDGPGVGVDVGFYCYKVRMGEAGPELVGFEWKGRSRSVEVGIDWKRKRIFGSIGM